MPPKQSLEKLSWQWAESTDPEHVTLEHIRTSYRLNLPTCKLAACKRQCKGNPYCINCIGEKVWFGVIDDSTWHDIQDPVEERRKPGMFVGLKNLGATCYVNTFLQLWFMNDTIKKGVYQWREAGIGDGENWEPNSVCSHLQVIFGELELSKRRYIDPSKFIKHLALDAGQQQDAQEFSNLFLSVLEQNLQQDSSLNGNGSNVIKEQLCGTYAYVTTCSKCLTASERPSEFYELDLNIQGHRTLANSLKGFLEVEKLDGDNQYMCYSCQAKQDANRAIKLKSLPPVLNLQLLRFVFDLKTGSKKKLNSCIQFPDVLDMREYLPSDEYAVYDLSAVLIHRGASAYSGHYVAHIKGKDSQAWYKFNDEEVEKIKGRSLQLGSEEDLEAKKEKSTRTPKGHHSSKNAYMLVYTKRKDIQTDAQHAVDNRSSDNIASSTNEQTVSSTSDLSGKNNDSVKAQDSKSDGNVSSSETTQSDTKKSDSAPVLNLVSLEAQHKKDTISEVPEITKPSENAADLLPRNVLEYVEKDNEKFENWILEMNNMREDNVAKGQEKQETVKAIYQELPYDKQDEDKFEWLPMDWLSKWLVDPATAPEIDVSELMCSHSKVSPEQCLKMKCVSQRGSQQLFCMYGGKLRLQGNTSLCDICVRNKCNLIRTKKRIAEDDKFISAVMKTDFSAERCFWIGKGSFRSWRRLAVEVLDEDERQLQQKMSGANIQTDDQDDETNRGDTKPQENGSEISEDGFELSKQEEETKSPSKLENENGNDSDTSNSSTSNGNKSPVKKCTSKNSPKQSNGDCENDSLQFNEDLLCDLHDGLDPDPTFRRLVPESVWIRLKRYFPKCAEFEANSLSCEKCTATIEAENESRHMNKQLAAVQKACLVDLFHDRKRPTRVMEGICVYAISTEFVESWRKFVRDPLKCEPVTMVINSILLCEHNGFLYPPAENDALKCDSRVIYLTNEEWLRIKGFFDFDHEISLFVVPGEGASQSESVTVPKVCDDCLQSRLSYEEGELFDYEKGVIYVRKLQKIENKNTTEVDNLDTKSGDPEFSEAMLTNSGKKRVNSATESSSSEPPEKCAKIKEGDRTVRKSQRHRRARGEKEVNISSKQTLKDLKVEIMKQFHVAPFDQNLYIEGRLLSDNSESLANLRVASGSVVELVADEPQEEIVFLEESSKEARLPEAGFKGTNLLSA